jgi:transcriptional regulator of arginine metabolism
VSAKQHRQQAIGRLIGQHAIGNQPHLLDLLAREGVRTTQATLSRDLDELGVIKVRAQGGQSVYALPVIETDRIAPFDQLRRVLGEWVADVASSGNIVVLRTPPGCAHVVASKSAAHSGNGLLPTRPKRLLPPPQLAPPLLPNGKNAITPIFRSIASGRMVSSTRARLPMS